jgi:hypothetical protein
MTLKEKLYKLLDWNLGGFYEIKNEVAEKCEQIADEHATEFATWVVRRMLEDPTIELKDDTLGKFKKEKGL